MPKEIVTSLAINNNNNDNSNHQFLTYYVLGTLQMLTL